MCAFLKRGGIGLHICEGVHFSAAADISELILNVQEQDENSAQIEAA